MKVRCPWCSREIGCHIPKGGDGSTVRLSRHYPTKERRGPTGGGSGHPICRGSGELNCDGPEPAGAR